MDPLSVSIVPKYGGQRKRKHIIHAVLHFIRSKPIDTQNAES